jgi:molecular chaperone GrpE (heat shock protein)|tara:strand:- start:131 stop:562 length:432 start_codon:yes stop_codon:yes gene_type:complete
MLTELAAANAAFAIIKQAVSNGKDIASAGSAIAEFVGAKEKLQQKAQRKGGGSDLEEFLALEKIREQEEQLKQIMIYVGRPGLWHDWQRFQAKARVARREAEQERIKRRKHHFEVAVITFFLIVVACILASIVLLVLHHQGRL